MGTELGEVDLDLIRSVAQEEEHLALLILLARKNIFLSEGHQKLALTNLQAARLYEFRTRLGILAHQASPKQETLKGSLQEWIELRKIYLAEFERQGVKLNRYEQDAIHSVDAFFERLAQSKQ